MALPAVFYCTLPYCSNCLGPITIKDIARVLNLSKSTVSRALRDSHETSLNTKRLVLGVRRAPAVPPQPHRAKPEKQQPHLGGLG